MAGEPWLKLCGELPGRDGGREIEGPLLRKSGSEEYTSPAVAMVAVMSTARRVDESVVVVEEDELGEGGRLRKGRSDLHSKIGRDEEQSKQSRKRLSTTSAYDVTCLQIQTPATTQSILIPTYFR